MNQLHGKVVIITGAADGIGAGVAARFADDGAHLVLADLQLDRLQVLAKDLRERATGDIVTCHSDVTRREEVHAMVALATQSFGTVDALVNNAWGGGKVSRLEDKTDELMQHGLDVAYFGSFWAMQAAFPVMKQRGGSIINLCSLNGVNAHMGTADYNGAKEALRALTRTAAREWAPYGIRANAVCPGAKSAAFKQMAAKHSRPWPMRQTQWVASVTQRPTLHRSFPFSRATTVDISPAIPCLSMEEATSTGSSGSLIFRSEQGQDVRTVRFVT